MGKAKDTGGRLEKEQTERPEVARPTKGRADEHGLEGKMERCCFERTSKGLLTDTMKK